MLYIIKKEFPDAIRITTFNENSNASMLSINKQMGFKKHLSNIGYKFKLNDVEKRVKYLINP